MTVSEIISTLSLLVSAGALLYTVKSVNASRRATQLQIFDGIFREIKRLDAEYAKEFRNTRPTPRWCDDFFNTIEYMAFLLNHKMILQEEMHDFYGGAVIHWYTTFEANVGQKDLDNPDYFPEFKKLYRKVQHNGRRQVARGQSA